MHATCAMYSSILYISQMIVNINCPSKVVSRRHVLSYVNLTLNVKTIKYVCLRAKEIGWEVFKPPYTYHI